MKKITIGFILFLLAWQLQAANTLKIGEYQVLPTTNFLVQIEAENSDPIVAFQVDIPIPTGFKYVDGSAVLNASRVSGHALSANLLTGNILRLIGYSVGNTAFLGNSGTLVSFTLKSGAVPATFPLEINQALLGDSQSNNILTSFINGQVTVLAPNISLSALELNYSRIPLGTVAEQSFQINNTGNNDLIINNLNFNDAQFSTTEPANFTISANSSRNILVKFTPTVKATLAKHLQIGSNDPDQPTANIALNAVAFAINEIHSGNITAASSTISKLDLTLNNMETFTGFQFDLNLPLPMTYIAGTAQLFRAQDQTVSVNQINSQTLRVIVFSAGNKNFSGTNGKVLSLDFLLNGVAGYYSIGISNVIIANAIGENIVSDSYQGYLQISSPDIETSSQISFGDVSILANSTQQQRIYNYGQEPLTISQLTFSTGYFKSNQTLPIIIQPGNYFDLPVEFAKAVKGSATGTMKIINNDPDENPFTVQLVGNAFTPNYLMINNQRMKVDDNKEVSVEIENEEPFVALQFDLTFPEGFTPYLNAIALSARKQDHLIAAISLSNTSLRIIAYSPSQKAFTGKSGSILTIPFLTNGLPVGSYSLTFSNSLLSNVKSENILYSVKNGVLDVMLSTGVEKLINENEVHIYPNPASDHIYISTEMLTECCTFELMDMRGVVVLRKPVDTSKNIINIESLTNGLYIYRLINNGRMLKLGKILKK